MAVKFLGNKGRQIIEYACKYAVMQASGDYDFFVENKVRGARRKSYPDFLKEGVSIHMIVARWRALAWERHVGLRTGD